MRRRERRMLRWATEFLVTALDEDPDLDVYWEWTNPCSGWQQGPMVKLEQDLQKTWHCMGILPHRWMQLWTHGLQE